MLKVGNSLREDKSEQSACSLLLSEFPSWFTEDEKATELERRGADSIIVDNDLRLGFDCWKEAAKLRPISRRIPISEENLLPMARRYMMKPPWMNYNDLMQMEQVLETEDGKLNAVYQAMLVRLGLGIKRYSDFHKLLVCFEPRLSRITHAKLVLLFFEWDTFYTSTDPSGALIFDTLIFQIQVMVSYLEESVSCPREEKLELDEIFQNILRAVLERLVKDQKSDTNKNKIGAHNVIKMLAWLTELEDEELISQTKSLVRDIVAADSRPFDDGANLFLHTCQLLAFNCARDDRSYEMLKPWRDILRLKQLVRLFVECGADVNSVDNSGNTCLHALMSPEIASAQVSPEKIDWVTVAYLKSRDVNILHKVNKRGLEPYEGLLDNLKEAFKNRIVFDSSFIKRQ